MRDPLAALVARLRQDIDPSLGDVEKLLDIVEEQQQALKLISTYHETPVVAPGAARRRMEWAQDALARVSRIAEGGGK